MDRISVGVVACVLTSCLLAQSQPAAPAGESAPIFSPAEANAAALCEQLAACWRADEAPKQFRESWRLHGYHVLHAARDADDSLKFLGEEVDPAKRFAGGEALVYLVPERISDATRRVFCVRGDGVVACTDNTVGTAMGDARAPAPDDALGDGGKGTLLDFPRHPARGRDGNLWLPIDMVARRTVRLKVVDEQGQPLGVVGITIGSADSPEQAIGAVLPAGATRTLLEGDGALSGVPARGLGIDVMMQGSTLPIAPAAVQVDGNSVRITVARDAVQKLRMRCNEEAAIATLKNISSGQAQCQASSVIDVNKNGAGEYGTFAELAGRDAVRGSKQPMQPPVLSTAFGHVENGVVTRSGYCFRIWLPGKAGVPVGELKDGGPDAPAIDAALAETMWCVYAWPKEPGVSGQRAFFINQAGDVTVAANADGRYAGAAKPPKPDAAFAAAANGNLRAPIAANNVGNDGQTWQVIQ